MLRTIVNQKTGTKYQECPRDSWGKMLAEFGQDRSKPCPVTVGHPMFRRPAEYGCLRVGVSLGNA